MTASEVLLAITAWGIRIGLSVKAFLLAWVLLGFAIFGGNLKASELALAFIPPLLCLVACLAIVKALAAARENLPYQLGGLLLLLMPLRWLQLS